MRVLGLCSYPVEAAATRFRMVQFVEPLARRGIDLESKPFLNGRQFGEFYSGGGVVKKVGRTVRPALRRLADTGRLRRYDLIFVQREAMFFGPGIFEWLYHTVGRLPMVLDLDDATYVRYVSPSYGRMGSLFKFFGKTDSLIKRAAAVTCGNRFIAEYVESKGTKSVIIPTVVDLDEFTPITRQNEPPVIGWIGTHSTFPFLEWLFPILKKLAERHRFSIKIVGAGRPAISLSGVEVANLEWNLEREVADFQSLDIGLYPMTTSNSADSSWLLGKSGFKAIQYMSVGVPFVMTPVGITAEIGVPGTTHLNAETLEHWYNSLHQLLSDIELRKQMGRAGRVHAIERYSVDRQVEKLSAVFEEAAGS